MERFSESYKVCRKVFQNDKFADDWHKFLHHTVKVSSLLGSHGPNPKHATGLDKLRQKILATSEGKRGPLLTTAATNLPPRATAPQSSASPA